MSTTAVPIPPIPRSSLVKFWVGMGLIVAAALGLAWWGTAGVRMKYQAAEEFLAEAAGEDGVNASKSGLLFKVVRPGEGPSPTDDDVTLIKYKGTLRDGTVFDQQEQAPMPVAGVVPGFSEALKKMQVGGKYKMWIPPEIGYGMEDQKDPQTGQVRLPGGSVLIFEVDLLDFKSRTEIEAAQQELQKQQGGAGGGGAPQGGQQQLPPELQQQLEQQLRGQGPQ
jgi:FKBP-type peptidyl-prolyl cis-trans isomerase FkpA